MNIVQPILFQAKLQPEAPALCSPGVETLSYARLRTQMNAVARRAMQAGLRRGSIVALSIDQPLLHATLILGLSQAGIIPVSVATERLPDKMKIDALISNIDYPHRVLAQRLPLDFSWIFGEGPAVEIAPAADAVRREICCILLTTGTTGHQRRSHSLTNRSRRETRVLNLSSATGTRLSRASTCKWGSRQRSGISSLFMFWHVRARSSFAVILLRRHYARSRIFRSGHCWRHRLRLRISSPIAIGILRSTSTSTRSSRAEACCRGRSPSVSGRACVRIS